jgi:hydrogenase maturation factor HypE
VEGGIWEKRSGVSIARDWDFQMLVLRTEGCGDQSIATKAFMHIMFSNNVRTCSLQFLKTCLMSQGITGDFIGMS